MKMLSNNQAGKKLQIAAKYSIKGIYFHKVPLFFLKCTFLQYSQSNPKPKSPNPV